MKKLWRLLSILIVFWFSFLVYWYYPEDTSRASDSCFTMEKKNLDLWDLGIFHWLSITRYNCKNTTIVIPDTYDWIPVVEIWDRAFSNKKIQNIIIWKNIRRIWNFAFYENQIRTLDMPDNVIKLWWDCFHKNRINKLKLSRNLKSIWAADFAYNAITYLEIPYGVEVIWDRAFLNNEMTTLILPETIKEIQYDAFKYNRLRNITLWWKIEKIGNNAFCYHVTEDFESVYWIKIDGLWEYPSACINSVDYNAVTKNENRLNKLWNIVTTRDKNAGKNIEDIENLFVEEIENPRIYNDPWNPNAININTETINVNKENEEKWWNEHNQKWMIYVEKNDWLEKTETAIIENSNEPEPIKTNSEYEYSDLNINAKVLEDWTIQIKENFLANFYVDKHGIIRNIPFNYNVGWHDFHIEISDINVQWRTFKTTRNNKEISIKIWDANKILRGEQEYPISYTVYWLVRNYSGLWYAELYWNLVGYQFDTNINKVTAILELPKVYTWFTSDDFLITTDWTTKTVEEFKGTVDWSDWNVIKIIYDKMLPSYQWITLAIKFPNDFFNFDHEWQANLVDKKTPIYDRYEENAKKSMEEFYNNTKFFYWAIWIIVSVIVFILFFKYIFKKKIPYIVQYEPPKGITPNEMSVLYYKKVKPAAISSLLYQWAIEDKIKIENKKEKFLTYESNKTIIHKWNHAYTTSDLDSVFIPEYERKCWSSLFSAGKSEVVLPNRKFSKGLKEVNEKIYEECENKNLIKENKLLTYIIRALLYLLIPILRPFWPLILGFICFNLISHWVEIYRYYTTWNILNQYWYIDQFTIDTNPWLFAILLISLVLFVFRLAKKVIASTRYKNISYTEEWKSIISEIYGYREFLRACEEKQLRTFISENPNYINKVLPYAAALGMEQKLLKKLIPIYEEKWKELYWFDGDIWSLSTVSSCIASSSKEYTESHSSVSGYSSDSWFDSWSSFSSWWSSFSSWGGWGWGWWSSW